MLSIPDSLHEAAKIDGCGSLRTYWSIILPLSKTGLATLTVLTFNSVWNDYMGPMLYLDSDNLRTISWRWPRLRASTAPTMPVLWPVRCVR